LILGNLSKIISDIFVAVGLTATERVHLILGLPCHSVGAFVASAISVIVQSPGDVSSSI
jgi:hypothetical protein